MAESKSRGWSAAGLRLRALLAGSVGLVAAGVLLASASAGADSPLPLTEAPPPADAPAPVEVIFTGVARRVDKGVSIFVRMTGEVPVSVEHSGRRLVYHLAGAKLGVPNNANPLPAGQFGPPVSNIALVAADGAVDVVIDLTSEPPGDAAPAHRVGSQSGLATLVIELPPPA